MKPRVGLQVQKKAQVREMNEMNLDLMACALVAVLEGVGEDKVLLAQRLLQHPKSFTLAAGLLGHEDASLGRSSGESWKGALEKAFATDPLLSDVKVRESYSKFLPDTMCAPVEEQLRSEAAKVDADTIQEKAQVKKKAS